VFRNGAKNGDLDPMSAACCSGELAMRKQYQAAQEAPKGAFNDCHVAKWSKSFNASQRLGLVLHWNALAVQWHYLHGISC